jgi:hypothetical protein
MLKDVEEKECKAWVWAGGGVDKVLAHIIIMMRTSDTRHSMPLQPMLRPLIMLMFCDAAPCHVFVLLQTVMP